MQEKINLVATEEDNHKRIDAFIANNTDLSRNYIQQLIENKAVLINGLAKNKSYKLKENDEVEIIIDNAVDVDIIAQDIPLDIFYEDDDLLVVNKPKGMVVHPANGNYENTLVNALLFHCKDSLSGINGQKRPGIVHRIDKDTSGLLLVAKNDFAHESLSLQFKEHSINREYNAIVYGNVKTDSGIIDEPIGRHKTDRKKFCVTQQNSKNAYTYYEVIERLNGYTLIKAKLKTGRTHQIRVHMQHIRHPLAGDILYGPKSVLTELKGQALHAKTLGFIHPRTNEYMEFSAPWCYEFNKFYNKVR